MKCSLYLVVFVLVVSCEMLVVLRKTQVLLSTVAMELLACAVLYLYPKFISDVRYF